MNSSNIYNYPEVILFQIIQNGCLILNLFDNFKMWSLRWFFMAGKRNKSHRIKSGEQVGCSWTKIDYSAKKKILVGKCSVILLHSLQCISANLPLPLQLVVSKVVAQFFIKFSVKINMLIYSYSAIILTRRRSFPPLPNLWPFRCFHPIFFYRTSKLAVKLHFTCSWCNLLSTRVLQKFKRFPLVLFQAWKNKFVYWLFIVCYHRLYSV